MTSTIRSTLEAASDKAQDAAMAMKESIVGITSKDKEEKTDMPRTMKGCVFGNDKEVRVEERPFPSFQKKRGDMQHAVILKMVAAAICGSDLHSYNSRSTATKGMPIGHENVGEVVQVGSHVNNIKDGDLVVLPFNISCGTCSHCKIGATQSCESLIVNPLQTGGAYGYPMAGDWDGGQSQYLLVPFADFNCFKLDRNAIKGKLASITLMSDVLPTALHAVEGAVVDVGTTVYIAGAGPIGLAAAHFSFLKGASIVIVGDVNPERLKKAASMGCLTIDCGKTSVEGMNKEIEKLTGTPFVDCSIDCVGYEASAQGHGHAHHDTSYFKSVPNPDPSCVLNSCIMVTKTAGILSIPGVYLPVDPKAPNKEGKMGFQSINIAQLFVKGLKVASGQTPCLRYMPQLYKSIINNRTDVTKFLNINVIPIDQAPEAYEKFNSGNDVKYILDPNGLFQKYNGQKL